MKHQLTLLPSFALTLVSTATLLTPSGSSAQDIVSYHGATSAVHQAHFNNLPGQGYRVVDLTIYGSTASPTYAAVWAQTPGPNFVGIHDATGAEYQTFFDTWTAQGYVPTSLSGTGSPGNPRFAAVFEQRPGGCTGYHGLTQQQFWDTRTAERGNGRQLITADVYGPGSDPRYIVSFGPDVNGQGVTVSNGYSELQTHFDALTEGHARQSVMSVNDDGSRVLSLWRSDDSGDWVSHANMTGAQYQVLATQYDQAGFKPISLDASGSAGNPRFAAVWATSLVPVQLVESKTGVAVPGMGAFDDWALDWMEANEVPASSLAIVKDGRLVYTRGFTRGRHDYPVTQPDSLFECASTTKPLTSIAVHQHFDNPQTGLDPTDTMMSFFPNLTPLDSRLANTTVYDLLTHQGGWDRNVSPDPMVFRDETIATALGIALPISKPDILRYMVETQALDFTPGTQSQYSNFGFSVLGQILEQVNFGLDYPTIMQRTVFAPLGITRARIGGSLFSQQALGQVRSHLYDPWLQRSVMDPAQDFVAAQYGDLNYPNMDSHGGWIMAAPDFAKILASFDFGDASPLLDEAATADMWTVAPGYSSVMSGWFLTNVQNASGNSVRMMRHNGRLLGSTALVAHREDGISFVFFANGDKRSLSGGTEGVELSDLANQVAIWPNHDLFPSVGLPACRNYRAGTTSNFGISCDSTFAPMVLDVTATPDLGQLTTFRLRFARPVAPAFLMIGLTPITASLAPLGASPCRLYVDPIVSLATITNGAGASQWDWLIPDVPSAVGTQVFAQAAVVDPAANALGLVTSHRLNVTLGGFF